MQIEHDPSDPVRLGELAGLVYVPTPCPGCGAIDMDDANDKCRPSSDETGEVFCSGEFDESGISVQPTAESLAEMDAWIDEQVEKIGLKGETNEQVDDLKPPPLIKDFTVGQSMEVSQ
jgi:hypothetical protein